MVSENNPRPSRIHRNSERHRPLVKRPIEIDCEEVWRHISDYLDNEVDAGLRAVIAAHFKNCAHCSAVMDGTRNVVKLVGDGKSFDVPLGASDRFYRKLNVHLAAHPAKKPRR